MLDGADPSLLYEWQAFYNLHPFGEERQDIRSANICLAIMQAMGAKKKGGGQFKLDDFMPHFGKSQPTTQIDPVTAQAVMKDRYGKK